MAPSPAVHIIDDDEAVRDSMAVLLQAHGLAVETYASAREFLARRAHGVAGCVVTDVQMGHMQGLELLHILRSLDPALPVVVVAGRADARMSARAAADGAAAFLEKPFAPAAFVEAVGAAMARGAP